MESRGQPFWVRVRAEAPPPLQKQQRQPGSEATVIIIIFLFKCMAAIFLKASCEVR